MEGRGGEIPRVGQHRMEVGHIIPFFLPSIAQGSCAMSFCSHSISCFTHLCRQTDAARTWDMLRSWTQIDFEAFVGLNINSPTNAIFMTKVEHISFGNFDFFLEKELVSRFRGDLSLGLISFSPRTIPTSTSCICPGSSGV
jgi:hypothetical protein